MNGAIESGNIKQTSHKIKPYVFEYIQDNHWFFQFD